jgi:glycosyltransferase involved in cell wall biosynthesis
MEVSIIIPVYNEKSTIQEVIEQVQQAPYPKETIVVDHGSQDGTRDILRHTIWPENVHIFYHEKNKGKGAGIRTRVQHATKDVIVIQDADLEYDPKDLEVVLKPIADGKADVVYGSRSLGIHRAFLFWHYMGNKLVTFLTYLLYNNMLTDMETGYKAFQARS